MISLVLMAFACAAFYITWVAWVETGLIDLTFVWGLIGSALAFLAWDVWG